MIIMIENKSKLHNALAVARVSQLIMDDLPLNPVQWGDGMHIHLHETDQIKTFLVTDKGEIR